MSIVAVLALLAACTPNSEQPAPTSTAPVTTPETAITTTTTQQTSTTLPDCGTIPYEVGVLPERVDPTAVPTDEIERDAFTSVPGTVSQLWVDDEGVLAVAFIRGALPPEEWPGERGEVFIDGARGVAGPFQNGMWVVAWFEGEGDPCDQFYMVFYPPVEPAEVKATIESLDRTAG